MEAAKRVSRRLSARLSLSGASVESQERRRRQDDHAALVALLSAWAELPEQEGGAAATAVQEIMRAWACADTGAAKGKDVVLRNLESDLPAGLRLPGALTLTNCTTSLPADMEVGSIHVFGRFPEMPDGFVVKGDFSVECCSSIDLLPASVAEVAGDVSIKNCDAFEGFPSGFVAHGGISVRTCRRFSQLPARAPASLRVSGSRGRLQVPESWSAMTGSLCLRKCSEVGSLPALAIGGDLVLVGCPRISALPAALRVAGNLVVRGGGLTALPWDRLHALGDVVLGDVPLTRLPAHLRVEGDLRLAGCFHLGAMPAHCDVAGSLDLTGCTGMRELPQGLVVGGGLTLDGASLLQELGDGLRVGGKLSLVNCANLAAIGSDVSVGGGVDLSGCADLRELPSDLAVAGPVLLRGCVSLRSVPPLRGAQWGDARGLDLSGCAMLRSLPDDMLVPCGVLTLRRCERLLALPRGLRVASLAVIGLPGLEALPDDMEVSANLALSGCERLATVPATLGALVGGDVVMDDLKALEALPSGLRLRGSLKLSNCPRLAALPEDLRVDALVLSRLDALEALPGDLDVGGRVQITSCLRFAEVPSTVRASDDCTWAIRDCPALTSLSSLGGVLGAGASLDVSICAGLEELPEDLHVVSLSVVTCARLTALPEKLSVGAQGLSISECESLRSFPSLSGSCGSVTMERCPQLASLPAAMHVEGSMYLSDLGSLAALPTGLAVGQLLSIYRCASLESLPDGLAVGALEVNSCHALVTFPDGGLDVRGDFSVRNSLAGMVLPSRLRVRGSLSLRGCATMTELPDEEFLVDGNVDLEGCAAVAALPDCMLGWGMRSDGNPHDIYLSGSGLAPEELARLQALDNPAMRFNVSMREVMGGPLLRADNFPTLDAAAAFWSEAAEAAGGFGSTRAISPFVEPAYARGVLGFLSKLRRAKEFNNSLTKTGLASRVVQVLELVTGEDDGVREELVVRMADAVDTCSDKPMWALNQMQVLVQAVGARGDRAKLRALGMGVMRLEVVHQHVRMAMDAMSFVDDVCVYLRFEIALRESLQLPVSALEMLYPSYVTVSDESISAAEAEALRLTEEDLDTWLPNWSEWQRQDRLELAETLEFADLKRNSARRLSLGGVSLLGANISDPVRLRPVKTTWSLKDLFKHWVNTGMDLNNTPRTVDYMRLNLTKCI